MKLNPEKELPKVINMIRSHAHAFARRYGNPQAYEQSYEEFFSEACLGFMQACEKWEKNHTSKSKFSSWCYLKVYNHLRFYIRKKFSDRLVIVEKIKDEMLPPVPSSATFKHSVLDQMKDLSPEAQRLINHIIDHPNTDDTHPAVILREARQEMTFEGYDEVHQKMIIFEIKQALAK